MKYLALTLALVLGACGGGGGDDTGGDDGGGDDGGGGPGDGDRIVDLDPSQLGTLCAELSAIVGGPRSVLCTDNEYDFPDEATQTAECIDDYGMLPASCAFTVGQARGCAQAFADDACTAFD